MSYFFVVFGIFCTAIGSPGLWTGYRYGWVRYNGIVYWRNVQRRDFWETEISNGLAAAVGLASFTFGVRAVLL